MASAYRSSPETTEICNKKTNVSGKHHSLQSDKPIHLLFSTC